LFFLLPGPPEVPLLKVWDSPYLFSPFWERTCVTLPLFPSALRGCLLRPHFVPMASYYRQHPRLASAEGHTIRKPVPFSPTPTSSPGTRHLCSQKATGSSYTDKSFITATPKSARPPHISIRFEDCFLPDGPPFANFRAPSNPPFPTSYETDPQKKGKTDFRGTSSYGGVFFSNRILLLPTTSPGAPLERNSPRGIGNFSLVCC